MSNIKKCMGHQNGAEDHDDHDQSNDDKFKSSSVKKCYSLKDIVIMCLMDILFVLFLCT